MPLVTPTPLRPNITKADLDRTLKELAREPKYMEVQKDTLAVFARHKPKNGCALAVLMAILVEVIRRYPEPEEMVPLVAELLTEMVERPTVKSVARH
jgi:hypothetical protein